MSGEEDNNEWRYFEDTVPFDDDIVLETEAVNITGETQALDGDDVVLGTEALNFGGETQVMEDGDTQLLEVESESERTQVLENVDDDVDGIQYGDGDSGRNVDSKKAESSQRNSSDELQSELFQNFFFFFKFIGCIDWELQVGWLVIDTGLAVMAFVSCL